MESTAHTIVPLSNNPRVNLRILLLSFLFFGRMLLRTIPEAPRASFTFSAFARQPTLLAPVVIYNPDQSV
jgi:hypothetical protein